ncbi:universal stress protein [Haladaptatus halobius]|uniref:universal stress protein n=1 Tax=Haladaptatus halobius TaxID=2884875 RepID=UPI001D0BD0AB|nr:universal stress protein [Haladaptatus halobius]
MFRIVLATDGNEQRVRKQAKAIASLPDATESIAVTVLHVFKEVYGDQGGTFDMQQYAEPPESVAVASDYLEERGISVSETGASGDPADEILDVARNLGADQIVVGGRKRSPVGKAVFGSVAQDVILRSPFPVLVVGDSVEDEA